MLYSGITALFIFLFGGVSGLNYLWGINLWGFFGIPLAVCFALAGGILLTKNSYFAFDTGLSKVKFGNKELLITLAASFILFLVFSQSVFFLGDGYLRLRNTEALQYYSSGSPLGNYLTIAFYDKIAKPIGFTALFVWRLISYLSGIISILIFYFIGRKLFTDTKQFILAGLFVFSSGLSQIYFGYVESYPFYYTFLLGYFLSTLLMLKTSKYSLYPAVWLVSAFFISPTAIIFSPAILFAYYKLTLQKGFAGRDFYKFIQPVFLVTGMVILVSAFLYILGFTPDKYIGGLTKVNHILSLFSSKAGYGIIDLFHWNDIINQIFLVVPAVLILPFVKWKAVIKSENSRIIFLLISVNSVLLFMLVFKADISFVRDWDLFSIIAYPVIFLIITVLLSDMVKSSYGIYAAIVISIIQTIPWIYINSNEKMSLDRMISISEIKYLPDYAKSNNYDILRQYFKKDIEIANPSTFVLTDDNKEKLDKSFYYTELAYKYEKNERYLYNLALYAYVLKRKDDAKKYLNLLSNSGSENKHLGYAMLSKIYIDEGDIKSAAVEMKKIEDIFPESETIKLDLANLYYNSGEPRNSYNYFQKAYEINPENETTLDFLIELSYIADTRDKTIEYYRKYEKLKPGNPATYYNLAVCFKELGNKDSLMYYYHKAKEAGLSEDVLSKIYEK